MKWLIDLQSLIGQQVAVREKHLHRFNKAREKKLVTKFQKQLNVKRQHYQNGRRHGKQVSTMLGTKHVLCICQVLVVLSLK